MNKYFSILLFVFIVFTSGVSNAQQYENNLSRSICSFGVLSENPASLNKTNLQKAIDWVANSGAALFVEPSDKPYEILGDSSKNRNWMIAQGSIIANTGTKLEDVHPIIIDGGGVY